MSKFGGALKKLESLQPRVEEPLEENLKTGKPEIVPVAAEPEAAAGPEREKYSTFLDRELITALKLHAVRHRMKHHQVVEAALKQYLAQEGET
ncbi:hypothetical protein HNQ07_003495 [Deinococcus metalli]|uniref:Uncharacterized protein n=1 Tax=Deinococcus metalli TaxID=1141878 RepID=A0A7W8KGX9_9DEIO|nr:hypothetical protein [Deinococcus metalli]MBB5377994.1 hypothetical protein [Deinococcus metalli]GHF53652.1 hypothetical protein GCM10017781_32330 [Deinococcus metalli]